MPVGEREVTLLDRLLVAFAGTVETAPVPHQLHIPEFLVHVHVRLMFHFFDEFRKHFVSQVPPSPAAAEWFQNPTLYSPINVNTKK